MKIDPVSLMVQAADDVWRTLILPLWWAWAFLAGVTALKFFYPQFFAKQ